MNGPSEGIDLESADQGTSKDEGSSLIQSELVSACTLIKQNHKLFLPLCRLVQFSVIPSSARKINEFIFYHKCFPRNSHVVEKVLK